MKIGVQGASMMGWMAEPASADRMVVTLRSVWGGGAAVFAAGGEPGTQQGAAEMAVKPTGDHDQDPGADIVECRIGDECRQRDYGQIEERFLAPAAQHPVIDLQHVERCGQQQQIGEQGEKTNQHEAATEPFAGFAKRLKSGAFRSCDIAHRCRSE